MQHFTSTLKNKAIIIAESTRIDAIKNNFTPQNSNQPTSVQLHAVNETSEPSNHDDLPPSYNEVVKPAPAIEPIAIEKCSS
ncbi:hypothetical protein L596_021339 [Steinernema carpocapsae]|uniref:Uncharacterized protein n=1 Tax=Steinernema carpocapsae TaxID=34508 RepID=A0A4U5MIH0_STECR|nr:hypothetical protein L596_021339 [Steinernema carpocapsae]